MTCLELRGGHQDSEERRMPKKSLGANGTAWEASDRAHGAVFAVARRVDAISASNSVKHFLWILFYRTSRMRRAVLQLVKNFTTPRAWCWKEEALEGTRRGAESPHRNPSPCPIRLLHPLIKPGLIKAEDHGIPHPERMAEARLCKSPTRFR
jgi:hypothetical protein